MAASVLDQMTGVLPVVVVAGTATMMTKSMFDQGRSRSKKRSRRSRRGPRFGNFSNVGF